MFLLAIFINDVVHAKEISTIYCYYPESLESIESSEFSTGGGDKMVVLLELSGYEKGNYVTYVAQLGSVSGFLGMGRFTTPDKIVYQKWDKDYMVLRKDD
ncbi:MAG: hypothetical protein ACLFNO_04010 [Parcubacteria group bacterium]